MGQKNKNNMKTKRKDRRVIMNVKLQKMKYREDDEIFTVTCAVNIAQMGGEYTFCGNAIPDTRLDTFDCEAVGEPYKGKLNEVDCPNCLNFIEYVKSLK
jgi:hypothetical protein